MVEIGRGTWVAALALSIIVLLVSIHSAHATDIQAEVRVLPSVGMTCNPDPFVVGDKEKTITCFLEISNYDVSRILPGTLRLSVGELSVVPIPVLPNSPNKVGDFDKDGVKDMKVTFSKTFANVWFNNYLPTDYTFVATGEIQGVPGYVFTVTDRTTVITPSYTFVHFYGEGGQVTAIDGIDLSSAKITGSRIEKTGHQVIKLGLISFTNKWEDVLGTVTGEVRVQKSTGRYVNLPFTSWVRFESGNCQYSLSESSLVCDGQGSFYKRGLAVGYSTEKVSVHVDISSAKASLTAKRGTEIVFQQLNIPMKDYEFSVRKTPSFLYLT